MSIWARLHALYIKMGLSPLDEHIEQRRNGDNPTRALGASTWMCARAALDLEDGHSVTVVTHFSSYAPELLRMTLDFTQALGLLTRYQSRNTAVFSAGQKLLVVPEHQQAIGNSRIYHDGDWQERALRRAQGPFHMIREVRDEQGVMKAYAEDDEYLMDLPPEGVTRLQELQPSIPIYKVPNLPERWRKHLPDLLVRGPLSPESDGWADYRRLPIPRDTHPKHEGPF